MASTRNHTRGHANAHTRGMTGSPVPGGGSDAFALITEAGLELITEALANIETEH